MLIQVILILLGPKVLVTTALEGGGLVDIRLLAGFFQSNPERMIGAILVLVGC